MTRSLSSFRLIIAAFVMAVTVPVQAQAQVFSSVSDTFESPPISLSSSWAGGTATTANGLNTYTASGNWDDFAYFDQGIRAVSSGQGAGGSSNYLYIPADTCSQPTLTGLQTGGFYTISFMAAAGSSSGSEVALEFYDSSAFDLVSFSAGGNMLTGWNNNTGTPTSSGATLANSDILEWALPANAGYSTSALDSNGIPWVSYTVTVKYTGPADGTLNFNISAQDLAGVVPGGSNALVLDNFTAAVVPEPGSGPFILAAGGWLVLRRRREAH